MRADPTACQTLLAAVVDTGADVLVRVKTGRNLPVCRRLRDGSYLSRMGSVEVRVLCCEITIATSAGRRTGVYRLVTTITDPDCPAAASRPVWCDTRSRMVSERAD